MVSIYVAHFESENIETGEHDPELLVGHET